MQLRQLVGVALGICAVAGVVTAVADKGRDEAETAQAAPAAKQAPAKPAQQQPAFDGRTVRVTMKGLAFRPRTIRLRVGDRVIWRNRDDVVHDVTTEADPTGANLVDLSSPEIAPGARHVYVARYAGTAPYVCSIHPSTMHARIVVERRS